MRARDLVPVALVAPLLGFVIVVARSGPASGRATPAAEADAAPTAADRAAARALLAAESEGTYVPALLGADSVVMRWPAGTDTLRVYLEPAPHIQGWRQRRLADTQLAFQAWAPLVPVHVAFVGSPAEADVEVYWAERMAREREVGTTLVTSDTDGRIHHARLTLAVRDGRGEVIPDELAAVTALHEAGHALGLNHSPDSADLMAATYTGTVHGLSAADRATMRLWYRLPMGRL